MSVTLTDAQFADLLSAFKNPAPTHAESLSLGEACTRYIATKTRLAPSTHKLYRLHLRAAANCLGWHRPLASVTALDLQTYLACLKPGAAHNSSIRLRAFYRWAASLGLVPAPLLPTSPHKARGWPPWTEEDIQRYREHWAVSTRPRLVMEAALATGLRRGDLAKALWARPGGTLQTQKTGEVVYLAALEDALQRFPGRLGRRLSGHSLGLKFTRWAEAAGVKGKSLHGLRKSFLERAAQAGCTGPELMVLAGHKSLAMTSHYIRGVDRARLAASGRAKLGS